MREGRAATRADARDGPPEDYTGHGGPGLELVEAPASPEPVEGDQAQGEPRTFTREELRDVHREVAREELDSDSMAECGLEPVPVGNPTVYRDDDNRLYWWGIHRCGNTTSCPVCAPAKAGRRARELERHLDAHLAAGGGVIMATATFPHHGGHRLSTSYEILAKSWSKLKASAPWKRLASEIGYLGTVTATEVTHGAHGWHPHKHALILTDEPLTDDKVEELQDVLGERWADRIERWYWSADRELKCRRIDRRLPDGHTPVLGRPSKERGLRVQQADRDAAGYVAHTGLAREVTRVDCKEAADGHRTPWQILQDYARRGWQTDRDLWAEYARTMQGKPALVWSPKLRERIRARAWAIRRQAELGPNPALVRSTRLPLAGQRTLWRPQLEELRASAEPDVEKVVGFSRGLWWRIAQAGADPPEIIDRLRNGATPEELAWWADGLLDSDARAVLSNTGTIYALVRDPVTREWNRQ